MTTFPKMNSTPLLQYIHQLWMMALTCWREARGEQEEGWIAVLYTIKTRAYNTVKWEGNDIVSVCTKPMQYSSMTDPHDKQLVLFPQEGDTRFYRMIELADKVLAGTIDNPCPGADSYFAVSIPAPSWAKPELFIRQIGNHRFYRVL